MKNNQWYNIAQAAEDKTSAEVSIYDAIGGEISAKQFCEELKEIDADTLHLRINSPGGSVIDGIAIFNALERHPAKVVTHIDGLCASMASVIAMVGDEVHMSDNALFMIHNPWTFSMGDADELRADADLLDKMSSIILSSYGRSQYDAAELKDLMDNETWFTAQEALDAGFIDQIDGGLRAAASDFTALASSAEISIPADKQIASLNKQIEAVSKIAEQASAELKDQLAKVQEITTELDEAKAKAEAEEIAKGEALEIAEKVTEALEAKTLEVEVKETEIAHAKEITEEKVAAKAASLLQLTSIQPVADLGEEHETKLSDDDFWSEYNRIGDEHGLDAKNAWYAENKHRKI